MQDIIHYAEKAYVNDTAVFNVDALGPNVEVYENKLVDSYQGIINSYLCSPFFPWVCLILLVGDGSWHKPVNLVLIGHWLFRATGDFLRGLMNLNPKVNDYYWPYSSKNWLISNAIAHIFWLTGEIIGDWYLLLRTKAVTRNKNKIRLVFCTCILFNLTKVVGMWTYFIHNPMDLRIKDENDKLVLDLNNYNMAWWTTVFFIEVASCLYNLAVVYTLKKGVLYKIEKTRRYLANPFIEKFRQISEFRIITSMIISIVFLPFVAFFVVMVINEYVGDNGNKKHIMTDSSVEQLRQVVLSFNYSFIYIDQILLRRFARNNKIVASNLSNPNTSVSHLKSYTKMSSDYCEVAPYGNIYSNSNSTTSIPDTLFLSKNNNDSSDNYNTSSTYKDSYGSLISKQPLNSFPSTTSQQESSTTSKNQIGSKSSQRSKSFSSKHPPFTNYMDNSSYNPDEQKSINNTPKISKVSGIRTYNYNYTNYENSNNSKYYYVSNYNK